MITDYRSLFFSESARIVRKLRVEECASLDMITVKPFLDAIGSGLSYGGGRSGPGLLGFVVKREGRELIVQLENGSHCLLVSTSPYFGNKRWWFCCPQCDRRCRLIYLPAASWTVGCRACLRLTYLSQKYGTSKRQGLRMHRLKHRLGATGYDTAPAAPIPSRPSGMRRERYEHLVKQLRRVEEKYWYAAALGLDRFKNSRHR